MKKVTFLALHLGYGGIERSIINVANELSKKYKVEIISTYELKTSMIDELNKKIKVKYLLSGDIAKKVETYKINLRQFHFIKLFKELYRDYVKTKQIKQLFKDMHDSYINVKMCKSKMIEAIKNCDSNIIISARDTHNELLGKYGKKEVYKIGWEHNHHHGNMRYANKIVKSVKNLDAFVLVSPELKSFYETRVNCKCYYIPNSLAEIPELNPNKNNERIISVGRLSREKGFNDLIDVFSLVHKKYPTWKLDIIGDGAERSALEQKIERYYLKDYVTLHGYQDKEYINKMLNDSSIYVMSSYTESFGIVLLEAFSNSLPCIAFDSAEGANLLISDNWDGYLIKNRDKEHMAKRICELIKNKNRRIIMGTNAYKKSLMYNIDNVINDWIKLLER